MALCLQRIVLICVAAIMPLLMAATAYAQKPRGYHVEYLDSWPLTNQMRYIKARITPASGTASENIDFHVVANSRSFFGGGVQVSTTIEIRKGDKSASTVETGQLVVQLLGDISNAKRWIENELAVTVRVTGESLQFPFSGSPEDQASLLKELVGQGFAITSFANKQRSLEDAFLQVTKGRIQ